jgi:hypothetical protein
VGFVEHMAALHARFWGFEDTYGLMPMATRYVAFSEWMVETERARGFSSVVPRLAGEGWVRLAQVDHPVVPVADQLRRDPSPLLAALEATPPTLLQGDWKMGNLGRHADGRTILLDWAYPGRGPGAYELAWYLAINSARLPQSKEDTIEAYRSALERRGVETAGWFDIQLDLCLLGQLLILGWEKALGGGDELAWWLDRGLAGAARL